MQRNFGTRDRILRFTLGIFLLVFAWLETSWLALAFAIFTFYEVLTSWCIFYQFIGKNSCPINQGTSNRYNLATLALDSRSLALAGGALWGFSLFVMTIIALYTGYSLHWLTLVASIYPGYTISWEGSMIGLVYGFIHAAIGLFLLGWLYNKLLANQQ